MTGKQLKRKIDTLGITQRKLADDMGVTPQTISVILAAKDVRTSTVERVASVTNMPIAYFFNEQTDKTNTVASGNGSVAVSGNNNVAGNVTTGDTALLTERIAMLERLLDEKERTIKILMEK